MRCAENSISDTSHSTSVILVLLAGERHKSALEIRGSTSSSRISNLADIQRSGEVTDSQFHRSRGPISSPSCTCGVQLLQLNLSFALYTYLYAHEDNRYFISIMPNHAIGIPSRKLDEFEELVYEYTGRMGLGNEGVSAAQT